ncbi:MAG: rhodanese-like domain-containing protein, partial [Actinomycetota bacterium]
HIPIGQISTRFEDLDRGATFVVVCQIGQRSALVADFLNERGFVTHNLDGGLHSWTAAGLPLVSTEGQGELVDGFARNLTGKRITPESLGPVGNRTPTRAE